MFFKTDTHYQSFTKSLFDFARQSPKKSLNQFREFAAKELGFASHNEVKRKISKSDNFSLSPANMLRAGYPFLIGDGDTMGWGQYYLYDNEIHTTLNWGKFKEEVQLTLLPLFDQSWEIEGDYYLIEDECGDTYRIRFFKPITPTQVENTDELPEFKEDCYVVGVRLYQLGFKVIEPFPLTEDGESKAKKYFISLMKQYISNFDEYSEHDIENEINAGRSGFGAGEIIITQQ